MISWMKEKSLSTRVVPSLNNSPPLKMGPKAPKGNYMKNHPSIFGCELLVSGRVYHVYIILYIYTYKDIHIPV